MKGSRPRPCWNGCGIEIVHGAYPGAAPASGRYAWLETATGAVHRCAKQTRKAEPKPLQADPWATRAGRKSLRMGLSIEDLKRGLKVTGANYRPVQHASGCNALPWDDCACAQ